MKAMKSEKKAAPALAPAGYWTTADGTLVPQSLVKKIDKDRHKVVVDMSLQALALQTQISDFKRRSNAAMDRFVARSFQEYGTEVGGKKGNITLVSFDGKFKMVRQMQDTIGFDERLQAAKVIIDECVTAWSKTADTRLKVLALDAFQVDKKGRISTSKVLALRNYKIDDEDWKRAMKAINDSIQISFTKQHTRFYQRKEDGEYEYIVLDFADV